MSKIVLRTATGAGFVVLTIGCLLFNKYLFAAFFLAVMVIMLDEFFRMQFGSEHKTSRFLAIATAFTAFVLVFCNRAFGLDPRFISLAVLPLMVMMVYSMFSVSKDEFPMLSNLYAGLLYVAAPVILANFVAFQNGVFSGMILLTFFIVIWCSDTGAYIFGMGFGQKPDSRKLCPEISPKKSWWGVWGGIVFAVIAAMVLKLVGLLDIPMVHCAVLALLMSVTGVLGDLFESQWKRSFGIKDSGNVIPGHGGMLDRFDSALFAFSAAAIYLALFGLL